LVRHSGDHRHLENSTRRELLTCWHTLLLSQPVFDRRVPFFTAAVSSFIFTR
jgi:hypothetical protein